MNLSPVVGVQLVTETCCVCAVVFAMPAELMTKRREDQKTFHCPNGHPQSYTQSEADRLRLELKREQNELVRVRANLDNAHEARRREERRVIALKGALTKAKKACRG